MDREIISGIYMIVSPSGRKYIGEALDIYKRWRKYKLVDCINQKILYRSLKKYGVENHQFIILEKCQPDLLHEREIYYIKLHNSCHPKRGMNCTLGGGGVTGIKWSEKSKNNFKKTLRNKYDNGYVNHFKGKKHTEETKRKIGEKSKGRKLSEESKKKGVEWRKDPIKLAAYKEKKGATLRMRWKERKEKLKII